MARVAERKGRAEKVADIVRDAGGRIVGRTRLQKIGYLLELMGLGDGFAFEYRHYGPYSDDLAAAVQNAQLLGLIREEEHPTSWGGFYSVFTAGSSSSSSSSSASPARLKIIREAAEADPIELELAATAAFLATKGSVAPWEETEKRKPEKAQEGRLENARALYRKLARVNTPNRLPEIV